jgi:hypothetical protein
MHPAARSSLRRATCVALLLTQLSACMTWRPVPGALGQQVGAEPISRARLRLRSGGELSLEDVRIRNDSVVGYSVSSREWRAFPVGNVTSIDRRGLSAGRTAAVVVGTGAVAYLVMYGLAFSSLQKSINAVPAPRVP